MNMRYWWEAWHELVHKLLALLAAFASLVALLLVFLPPFEGLPWWAIVLLVLAGIFVLVLVALELNGHRRRRVYANADAEGIKKYMHNWIEHGGRVAIWTRDISWAENPGTRKLLSEKARRKELILCMPEPNELATELEREGAEVCAYGTKRLEAPASRFTIAYFGRDGARVAVGRAQADTHVIDEFSAAEHPAFHLAADLVELVRKLP